MAEETSELGARNRIDEAMELRGMSARQLNRELGFTQQQSWKYRTGKRVPDAATMGRVSRLLGQSLAYLYGIDETDRLPVLDGQGRPTGEYAYAPADKIPADGRAHWERCEGFSAFGVPCGALLLVEEGAAPAPGKPAVFSHMGAHIPAHLGDSGDRVIDDRDLTAGFELSPWPSDTLELVGKVVHYQAAPDWA